MRLDGMSEYPLSRFLYWRYWLFLMLCFFEHRKSPYMAETEIEWLRRQLKDYKIAHESVARDNERLEKERDRAYGMGYESAKSERTAILRAALKATRNQAIEDCALVAQLIEDEAKTELGVAAAIGALKEKS